MAQTQEKEIGVLENKIAKRRKFLNEVFDRITNLVSKEGEQLSYSEHSCHTNVVAELKNFGNFTFTTNLDQSMIGGDTIRVYYHPGRKFQEGGTDAAHDKGLDPVLAVDVDGRGIYTVRIFDEQRNWQKKLLHLLKNSNKIAKGIRKAKERAEKEAKSVRDKRHADEEKRKRLLKEAENLRIS